jgi:hypothetical protein
MNRTKSQTTVEFVLLVSAVLMFMLIVLFVVANYALKSGEDITASQLNQIGWKMVDQSREIFYLGLFSREIISVNFPEGVNSFSTLNFQNETDGSWESYLIINYQKGKDLVNMTFPSEVPLLTGSCTSTLGCLPGITCLECSFGPTAYSAGRKDLKLECILLDTGDYAVNITNVSI